MVNTAGHRGSGPRGPEIEDYADRMAVWLVALRLPPRTDVLGKRFGRVVSIALAVDRIRQPFRRLIVADALAAFPAREGAAAGAADRWRSEGMDGRLDIAIRAWFPKSFIAAHPDIVDERKRALEKADVTAFARRASRFESSIRARCWARSATRRWSWRGAGPDHAARPRARDGGGRESPARSHGDRLRHARRSNSRRPSLPRSTASCHEPRGRQPPVARAS